MNRFRVLVLVSLFLLATVLPLQAQHRTEGVQFTPWLGAFLARSSSAGLPRVDESGAVEASMTSSPAVGVDVEASLPLPSLRVRGSLGLAFFSSVEFANWDGEYTRGTTHHSFGNPQGVGSSVWLLTGSAVLRPWPDASLPYFLAGVGIKRYNYANMAGELERVLSSNQTRAAFHVGLGWPVTRRLRIEVSDHISRQNFVFEVPQMVRLQEPVQTQHDLVLTFGYRFNLELTR